jgi:glycosyltransferase involved in cell wall biosynthesis
MANGLNAVLDAARELKARGRADIYLIFIGDGSSKPALQERARCEQLDNCRFLDPMPRSRLAMAMSHAHVGLMILADVPAFYYGTSPNKFFDYIACGLPVLNNYPGWLAELIQKNQCGLAVPPGDPLAFADALEYFADHEEERRQMGGNSRRLAEREFSRAQLAARWVDFVEAMSKGVKR